jgi:hypothetical protein
MAKHHMQKPGVEEWTRWANVVIDRLTDCVHVYKKPPYADVFIPDAERQHKNDKTIKLLQRIHALVDRSETPTDSIPEVHVHDERVIGGLSVIFAETVTALPQLSADMQKLLKSPWMSNFPNKTAETLFYGSGIEAEGIGSGHPEHGRLPAVLASMLEREQMGDDRYPREDLLHQGEPRRNDAESRTRWAEQNSRFLRTAGRVE